MPRKIALSFLGTNDYIDCHYYLENQPDHLSVSVKYMQEAIADLICPADLDTFYVFVTKEAREANWENNGLKNTSDNIGLERRLSRRGVNAIPVPIEAGFSEAEIWKIFESIVDCIEPEDEVILDITHAFRSLPTLGTVLIPYCRTLKSANFVGIYYGAFEKLGMAYEVKHIPLEQRKAPIINLISFLELMDWSSAADHIIRFGSLSAFAELAQHTSIEDGDVMAKGAGKALAKALKDIEGAFYTVRGAELVRGDMFRRLNKYAETLQTYVLKKPYATLLAIIKKQFNGFKETDLENGLLAVKWCIDNRLTQQGITLLREWACIFVLDFFGKDHSKQHLKEATSSMLSGFVGASFKPDSKEEYPKLREEEIALVSELEFEPLVLAMQKIYKDIKDPRNDINHAGFNRDASIASKLEQKLTSAYEQLLAVCKKYQKTR